MHMLKPLTGEYINPPPCEKERLLFPSLCGLRFCPKTNQFKAFRVAFPFGKVDPFSHRHLQAKVYTLATGTWRSTGAIPSFISCLWDSLQAVVNGSLHCLADWEGQSQRICVFDFEREQFRSIS